MNELKTFSVYRRVDQSGVSGAGRILDGVIFHTGWVVVCWRTDIDAAKHGHSNLGIYQTWEDFKYIHIDSHPENKSLIVYGSDANLQKQIENELKSNAA